MTWESFHVFIHDDTFWVPYLLQCVEPLMNALRADKAIDGWFYVRYWEGGPHIRIRVAAKDPLIAGRIEQELCEGVAQVPLLSPPLEREAYYSMIRDDHPPDIGLWYPDHSVLQIAYMPEIDRYGGPEAMPINEALFTVSTQVALRLLRETGSRPQLIGRAFDLLFGALSAMDLSSLEMVRWLRMFVGRFHIAAPGSVDVAQVQRLATQEFSRNPEKYVKRMRHLQHLAEHPSTERVAHITEWQLAVSSYRERILDVRRAGLLTMPPEVILMSQVHMFHNRLGIAIPEECYLALLMVHALVGERGDFFDDTLVAPDRVYQEAAVYIPGFMEKPRSVSHDSQETLPGMVAGQFTKIPLPPQGASSLDRVTLGAALKARETSYGRYGGTFSLDDVGTLLQVALGVTRKRSIESRSWLLRAYPSPGALFSIRVFLYAHAVQDLLPAVYEYDPTQHQLLTVSKMDAEQLLKVSPFTDPGEDLPIDGRDAPLWLFLVLDDDALRKKYGLRGQRLGILEAGHMMQNVCLVAAGLGWNIITLGGFYDQSINLLLGLDGVTNSVVYMAVLGVVQEASLEGGDWR